MNQTIAEKTAAIGVEVKNAANDLARRGFTGVAGDPLPNLMSVDACRWINAYPAVFKYMVTQAAREVSHA